MGYRFFIWYNEEPKSSRFRKENNMKVEMTYKTCEELGEENFKVIGMVEKPSDMEELFNKLFNIVRDHYHLGASVTISDIDGWPAIHIEDEDTMYTEKVIMKKVA